MKVLYMSETRGREKKALLSLPKKESESDFVWVWEEAGPGAGNHLYPESGSLRA